MGEAIPVLGEIPAQITASVEAGYCTLIENHWLCEVRPKTHHLLLEMILEYD